MCPCDPVVLFSISSSQISLYLSGSIIISLIPLEPFLELLFCSLNEVSDVGTFINNSIHHPFD